MKVGRSLSELAAEIERQAATRHDYVADTGSLQMGVERDEQSSTALVKMQVGPERYGINNIGHTQIGAYTKIPGAFYDRLLAEHPALLARNVNTLMPANDKRMVRTLDSKVRAFLSPGYRIMANEDLAHAVLPILAKQKLQVVSCEVTERRLYLKAVHQSINAKLPPGTRWGDGKHVIVKDDVGFPAVCISNSEVGLGYLTIETGMLTHACTNLAFFAQSGMRRRHVGARHEITAGYEEVFTDETRRITDEALWRQVRDVVGSAFDEKVFVRNVDRIAAAADNRIESNNIPKVVEVTARKLGITEGESGSVLRFLIEGGDLSQYGLFNAVTRTAQELDNYDRATDFERLGPQVIDLTANDWREISQAA